MELLSLEFLYTRTLTFLKEKTWDLVLQIVEPMPGCAAFTIVFHLQSEGDKAAFNAFCQVRVEA